MTSLKNILLLILLAVIILAAVRFLERKSIFFPMREIVGTPRDIGLKYEEVYFTTQDNKKLNGWFIPRQGAEATILFSNGNAGNISYRLEKISIMNEIGFNILVFDYRGYGKSEGAPSEQGFYSDIQAAYNYLVGTRGISPGDIILYGESIGGAVVIELAGKSPVKAVIIEAAFTSVKDMASIAFPGVPHFILESRFDSLEKIKDIKYPKLLIHSMDDEIVPFEQGERLFSAALEPKESLKLKGGHNTAFRDSLEDYKKGIAAFAGDL